LPGDLLTAAAIASEVGIPESTARYYLRKYAAWVPTVGTGRQRRYRREAVAVLRFVAELHREGTGSELVEAALRGRFPTEATAIQPQQQQVATQQQDTTKLLALIEAVVRRSVEDQLGEVMAEVAALNEKVDRLTALLAAQQGQQGPQPTATAEPQPPAAPIEASDPPAAVDQVSQPTPARPSRWDRFRAWLAGE
jgi:DNA-binding transcriptional MerR regulator